MTNELRMISGNCESDCIMNYLSTYHGAMDNRATATEVGRVFEACVDHCPTGNEVADISLINEEIIAGQYDLL
ncbi:MAG: hypothetical protein OEY79_03655 [Anaplasmataceae bacterium]|nr:hypothetical protein [Anaplasmataceae bacterium]